MFMMEKCSSFIDNLRIFVICQLIINNCNGLSYCSQDPCVSNTLTLSNGSRTENCPNVQYSNCDAYISSGWYRVDIPMLNYCPTNGLGYSCGTTFPAWMNGTDPTVDDGIVDREVCLKGPTSCCVETYAIQVKNCTGFMAYCLQPLRSCPEKYCFGTFGTCLSTTTTTATTTTTPTTVPFIDSITIKLEPAGIIPGIKIQRNASGDVGHKTNLKEINPGYIIGFVCLFVLIVLVVVVIIIRRRPKNTNELKYTVKSQVATIGERPIIAVHSATKNRVYKNQEAKIIHTTALGINKTARFHHFMETKNDNNVVSPSE